MSYTPPKVIKFQGGLLNNGAWGIPRGGKRRVKPWVLQCLHITGNSRTAANGTTAAPGHGTYDEVLYMARDRKWDSPNPDLGNSAHVYTARNGEALECISTAHSAWNNGPVNRPNTALASIRRIVAERARGINPNEAYVREIESTGYGAKYPLTEEQKETSAYFAAIDSIEWGLPISRETMHLHTDLDSVNKPNCPFHRAREEQMADIIARGNVIKGLLQGNASTPTPDTPKPEPEPTPDPVQEDAPVDLNAGNPLRIGDIAVGTPFRPTLTGPQPSGDGWKIKSGGIGVPVLGFAAGSALIMLSWGGAEHLVWADRKAITNLRERPPVIKEVPADTAADIKAAIAPALAKVDELRAALTGAAGGG